MIISTVIDGQQKLWFCDSWPSCSASVAVGLLFSPHSSINFHTRMFCFFYNAFIYLNLEYMLTALLTIQYYSKLKLSVSSVGFPVNPWTSINQTLDHRAMGFAPQSFHQPTAVIHCAQQFTIPSPSSSTQSVCFTSYHLAQQMIWGLIALIVAKTLFNSCCQKVWFTCGMLWLWTKVFSLHHEQVLQHICCRSIRTRGLACPAQTSAGRNR